MKKISFTKRTLALVLSLIMILGLIPGVSLSTSAAEQSKLITIGKIADLDSFDNWKDYYGTNSILPDGNRGISTWKAGGVWTDKSVYVNADKFPSSVVMKNQAHNFLIALSALASNKEIVGQASTPSDTVLVLDLSQSMDNSGSVDEMIEAANETLDTLLKMNRNNRVGVVLYSGNTDTRYPGYASSAEVILPLDRYTTSTTTTEWERGDNGWEQVTKYQYLTVSGDGETSVSVAQGTRNSNNTRPTGSKTTAGGTYIQNGLFKAWQEFAGMADKGVVQSGEQAGTQRQPILIMMSDGRPTLATEDYNNVGTSDSSYGDGSNGSTSWETVFLTQLTASWVKGAIKNHYNNTKTSFYTLGLGTGNDTYATAVLDPADANNTNIVSWWYNFQNGTNQNGSVRVEDNWGNSNDWYLEFSDFADSIGKNYVDNYWSASNVDEMIAAFKEIVAEIGLQSAYTATLVEKGEANLDGYITVQDELGSMMQVKDVKGILLGDRLFSGEEMAKSMNEGALGGADAPTAYGDEFVRTVKERLGLTDKIGANGETITATAQAQQLIQAAYMDGQLSYNASTGVYSNYIGWYGDENNAYLGFWDKDTGLTAEGAPANAKYINQSYGYLGGASTEEGAADMMHIVVMVRTEIATGHQTVLFRIPASLIPMVEYKVELEGDSLETATNITLTVNEADPIRLVYEVGLPDDVNSININQKVSEYLAQDGSNHIHKENGNYVFYANGWDDNHDDVAPIISDLTDDQKLTLTKYVAESHFVPNTVNERFYVQEDSVVYTMSGNDYIPVTTGIVQNTTYYYPRTIVTIVDGTARAMTQYEPLQPATVGNPNNFYTNDAGQVVIKAGTVRQQLSSLALSKDPNATDTLPNTDQLWVNVTGNNPSDFNIYSFLGNNGKLTVAPATGIKVTKDVTELADGASADEEFSVIVALNATNLTPVITDVNGTPISDYTTEESAGQTIVTLHLADNESAVISNLPAGVTYSVTETVHQKYAPIYTGATVTVDKEIVSNTVTNAPVKPGSLYITKEVVHAHSGEAFPTNDEFRFEVTFVDANGAPIADKEFQLENNYDPNLTKLSTDENGVMTGWLRHGETVHILGIPAGATVTVEESALPGNGNYTLKGYRSRNLSGGEADNDGTVTISAEHNATVVVTNTYTPKPTDVPMNVTARKTVESDTAVQYDVVLRFEIEKWNPDSKIWETLNGIDETWNKNDITLTNNSATKDFPFSTVTLGEFTEVGTYTYRVVEVEPNNSTPGLAYDKTVHTVVVTVTDNNGQLEATVTDENGDPITDSNGDGVLDFTAAFTNKFSSAPVSIEIVKTVDNLSLTPHLSKAGFKFAAYKANANWEILDSTPDMIVVSDSNGSARLTATYTAEGQHRYIVKELHETKTGWSKFSDAEYRVTVNVAKDNAGNLSATMTIVAKSGTTVEGETASYNGNSGTIIFKNTYNPDDAEVDANLLVKKELNGRDPVNGEFTFAIFQNGKAQFDADGMLINPAEAITTGTNDAQGNVTFASTLSFAQVGKYEYDIIEVKGNLAGVTYDPTIYDLVVEVSDDGSGTLHAEYYFEDSVATQVTFHNTYTVTPTEVVIEGVKSIQVNSGVKMLNAGDYTFQLFEADAQGNPVGNPLATTTNLANGTFKFDAIEYGQRDIGKTFRYVILEAVPTGATQDASSGKYVLNGVTYSDAKFVVEVTISDNGDGTLGKVVTGNGVNTIQFVNTYDSKLASVTLNGKKELTGRNLTNGEYQFILHESNASFTEKNAVVTQNGADFVTNDVDGDFTFKIENLGMGYHYYILSEVIPDQRAPGISYDANVYHITVQVSDSGNGQMNGMVFVTHSGQPHVSNPDIIFKNVYRPQPGEISVSGNKIYNGGKTLEDDVFSVGLYDASGVLLQTAPIKANGSFVFNNLQYQAEDVGNTYVYTVKEIIPDGAVDNGNGTYTLGKHIYDGSIYTLTVSISDDDKDGALNITPVLTKETALVNDIVFTNTFIPDPITHNIEAKKTYEKGLEGGEFEFDLVSADNKTNVNQRKKNDGNGEVKFDAITFTQAGSYKFTVKEIGKILGFIRYSAAEYEVTVTVVNENGVLRVSDVDTVNTKNTNETNLEFVNVYVMDGEDEITLRGTKKLTGGRTSVKAGEFEFGLYDANGKLVESVKNDADGKFAFTTLKFDETDVPVNGQKQITYTVKEIKGTDLRVTYDETVYAVVVTVKDNDNGGVTASYTVNGDTAGLITFTNIYTPKPEDITVDFNIVKTVVNKGSETISPEGFEFLLNALAEGVEDVMVQSDEKGKAKFTLTFTEDDIGNTYTYKLTEVNGGKANVTYSNAEYTITVAISLNENNKLVATLTENDKTVTAVVAAFENVYDYTPVPVPDPDPKPDPEPKPEPEKPDNPSTSDRTDLGLWLALLFVSGGIVGTVLYNRKRKAEEN